MRNIPPQAQPFVKEFLRLKREAASSIQSFTQFTKPDYQVNWHHKTICDTLDSFVAGDISRLMIFLPPQHGKSELATRRLAAYILGVSPSERIAVGGYSATLASKFNREIQRIIDNDLYKEIFPGTRLNSKNVSADSKGSFLRNSTEFEVVGTGGYLIAQGIGGALTSYSVDTALVDDPYKGPMDAYSETYRARVEEWWDDVLETRLHNNSRICLTMTRWHYNDIAGRLLRVQPGQWKVLKIPAIKEGPEFDIWGNELRYREEGEPLWPEKHGLDKLLKRKATTPSTFVSLYQQNPTPKEGNMIKDTWFGRYHLNELPKDAKVRFTIDGAYTSKDGNDPSVFLAYIYHNGNFYILDVLSIREEWPQAVKEIPSFIYKWDQSYRSLVLIEPKATGKSLVQDLRIPKYNGQELVRPALNVKESKAPTTDKTARLNAQIEYWESGKIYLPYNAPWVDGFVTECKQFPKGKHDDQVDCAMIMVDYEAFQPKAENRTGAI